MWRRTSLVLVLAAGVALAGGPTARIAVGFAGYVPARGGLVPVTVDVTNDGPQVAGVIRIERPGDVAEVEDLLLPPHSTRRYELVARVGDRERLEVAVVLGGQEVARTGPGSERYSSQPVVLGCGLPSGWWRTVQANRNQAGGDYSFLNLPPAELPTRALAYDSVAAVAVDGGALAGLSLARVRALLEWAQTGGALLIVRPVPDATLERRLRDAGASPNVLARGGLHGFGAGRLGVDRMDGRSRWASPGRAGELLRVLPPVVTEEEESQYHGVGGNSILAWYTARRRSWGAGGFFWLLLLVGGYLVAIGPLDALLNRRRGPPRWWIFVAAVVVFSVLGLWASRVARIGSSEVLRLDVVDMGPHGGVGGGETLWWLSSIDTAVWSLEAPGDGVGGSIRAGDYETGGATRATVHHGPPLRLEMRVPTLTSRTADLTWLAPDLPAVDISETVQGLRVTLPSTLPATAVWLADSEGVWDLGYSPVFATWRSTGTGRDWDQWLAIMARSEWNWQHSTIFGGGREHRGTLPGREELTDYLLFCSLAHPTAAPAAAKEPTLDPVKFSLDFPRGVEDALAARDERERCLNVASRLLAGDRVLLVALRPAADIFPLSLRGGEPEAARMTLLRIWLPATGETVL